MTTIRVRALRRTFAQDTFTAVAIAALMLVAIWL